MQSIMPTVGITKMRVVYNATVDNFVVSFYLMASGVRTVWTNGGISCSTGTECLQIAAEPTSLYIKIASKYFINVLSKVLLCLVSCIVEGGKHARIFYVA